MTIVEYVLIFCVIMFTINMIVSAYHKRIKTSLLVYYDDKYQLPELFVALLAATPIYTFLILKQKKVASNG